MISVLSTFWRQSQISERRLQRSLIVRSDYSKWQWREESCLTGLKGKKLSPVMQTNVILPSTGEEDRQIVTRHSITRRIVSGWRTVNTGRSTTTTRSLWSQVDWQLEAHRSSLWTPAQRKRASMLYFANVFIFIFIF